MSIQQELAIMGERARAAARELAVAGTEAKNGALRAMAAALRRDSAAIREANAKDLEDGRAAGLTAATLDRLALDEGRVEDMAAGLEAIAALQDPVGTVLGMWTAERGLRVGRVRVPLGVVGIIYEARPNVTADAAGLCLKSGNAVILRGGKEALRSNAAIARALSARRFTVEQEQPNKIVARLDTAVDRLPYGNSHRLHDQRAGRGGGDDAERQQPGEDETHDDSPIRKRRRGERPTCGRRSPPDRSR